MFYFYYLFNCVIFATYVCILLNINTYYIRRSEVSNFFTPFYMITAAGQGLRRFFYPTLRAQLESNNRTISFLVSSSRRLC